MDRPRPARTAVAVVATLVVFGAGFLSARILSLSTPAPAAGASLFPADAGAPLIVVESPSTPGHPGTTLSDPGKHTPKLLFDPDSVTLLPDASLRLDLRSMWNDGGAER